MLFDLKGKRRRVVQGVYLTLAILLGAGLVLFGVGSSVNGGLFDAFNGGGGSNQADESIQKRIDAANRTLQTNPKSEPALAELVRSHYQLATAKSDAQGNFGKDSLPELQKTDVAWTRYLAAAKQPSADVARTAVQAEANFAQLIANQNDAKPRWASAAAAQEIIAAEKPNPNSYINLVAFATLAGQTRKADLAGNKAIELAAKDQKKAAKQEVARVKADPLGKGTGAQPAAGQ
jgi:hypothetical protein